MFSKYLIDPRPFTLFNHLNSELNPICHLLALLEAHHILHVSRIRVKHDSNYFIQLIFYTWARIVDGASLRSGFWKVIALRTNDTWGVSG